MSRKAWPWAVAGILLGAGLSIWAQTVGVGGGSGAGSSFAGGTASRFVVTDSSGTLQTPASLVASTGGAGGGVLTFQDTMSGGSATSNFLNLTGTLPTVNTAIANAADFEITSAGSSAVAQRGLLVSVLAGYTGSASTTAVVGNNAAAGTQVGAQNGNRGVNGISSGSTAGTNNGVVGLASGSTGVNIGVSGASNGVNTNNIGVLGFAVSSTNNVGGYFSLASLGSVVPTITSAALVADNAAIAADIIQAKDNATTVWSIADGGEMRDTIGNKALAGDYTNATASFTSTNISVPVVSGRTYSFTFVALFADSTAADGAQFDFNGGSAAATNFRAHCTAANATGAALVLTNANTTALATAVQVALALTTQAELTCNGTFVPSGNGTFIPRAAQTAHSTGTLTVFRGTWLEIRDSNAQ